MTNPEPEVYRTIADMDDYFGSQLYADDWLGATTADKEKAQLVASRAADSISYAGVKATVYEAQAAQTDPLTADQIRAAEKQQVRQWPRNGANDPESWTLTIDATGGTYTLTFNSETTTDLAFNADAATIQTALESLASVTAGDVIVTVSLGGTDTVGPYDVTVAGDLEDVRYNTLATDSSLLTGGGMTAVAIVLNDNIPNSIFYAVCEEAKELLSGRDPDQEFRNTVLTSDGAGNTRVSSERSQMPPEHTAHFFTSPTAWKYITQFVADDNTFEITRTS